jgi:hypothetical protein
MDNLTKLAKQLRCNLYVDFGTDLESAFNAANILAGASREPAAVFTALYGVVNTLCNIIEEEANAQKQTEQVQTDTRNAATTLQQTCGADADKDC